MTQPPTNVDKAIDKSLDKSLDQSLEQIVADYLNQHPDFFNRHLDVLETLRVPHPCRPAVSLLERQQQLLRQQNAQLRKKLRDLVKIARDNDCLSKRMQHLNLVLLESTQADELLAGIQNVLRNEFSADFTALYVNPSSGAFGDGCVAAALNPAEMALFASLYENRKPLCGRLTEQQLSCLFDDAASQVGSTALIPLSGFDWRGLIAIGSRDAKRFHAGMGTLFLSRIGELVSCALQPHLSIYESA